MKVERIDYVVVPDLHGRPELLDAVMQRYQHVAHLILNGDLVDGPDAKAVLDLACEMTPESVVNLGNHEYVLDAALHESDPVAQAAWVEVWSRPYHDRVLSSYGLADVVSVESARALDEVMPLEHKALLYSAEMYVTGPGFAALHAGLTSASWNEQRTYLDAVNGQRRRGDFGYEIPLQIAGVHRRDASYLKPERVLPPDKALQVLDRAGIDTMVNGHWHLTNGQHRKAGGRVIHLANHKMRGELPVYEVWSDTIELIEPCKSVSVPSNYSVASRVTVDIDRQIAS